MFLSCDGDRIYVLDNNGYGKNGRNEIAKRNYTYKTLKKYSFLTVMHANNYDEIAGSSASGATAPVPPSSGGQTAPSSVTVTTTTADGITGTNATVRGTVSYTGSRPSKVGVYFGTSRDSLSLVASDVIDHNKNPFNMWYDLNKEAKLTLSPGTTYYWQCAAWSGGKAYYGAVCSFTTLAATIWVTTTVADGITGTNATVRGTVSYTGSRPTEAGIYFGTSPDSLTPVASDRINHNKNPFDMWYDLNKEAKITLTPGVTYYWQCYAIQDGVVARGAVCSFTA